MLIYYSEMEAKFTYGLPIFYILFQNSFILTHRFFRDRLNYDLDLDGWICLTNILHLLPIYLQYVLLILTITWPWHRWVKLSKTRHFTLFMLISFYMRKEFDHTYTRLVLSQGLNITLLTYNINLSTWPWAW